MGRITVRISDEPLPNRHRFNDGVHYRLYLDSAGEPSAICVQGFDYRDYAANRFLTEQAWDEESDADATLSRLLLDALDRPTSELYAARALVNLDAAVTREQAISAYVARERPLAPEPAWIDLPALAVHLLAHARSGDVHPEAAAELEQMAARIDVVAAAVMPDDRPGTRNIFAGL